MHLGEAKLGEPTNDSKLLRLYAYGIVLRVVWVYTSTSLQV